MCDSVLRMLGRGDGISCSRAVADTRTAWRAWASFAGWGSGLGLICVVAGLTFATRAHELPLAPFVSSATRLASGRVWVLPASALIVDRPVLVGLVAFGMLAVATLRFCGARTFWLAGIVGHVGSTLFVYAIIGATQLADPRMFAAAAVRPDFGVSAIQGAWVGAITATAWSRAGTDRRDRILVTVGVCAIGGSGMTPEIPRWPGRRRAGPDGRTRLGRSDRVTRRSGRPGRSSTPRSPGRARSCRSRRSSQ